MHLHYCKFMTAPYTPRTRRHRDRLLYVSKDVLCIIFPARRSTLVELSEGAPSPRSPIYPHANLCSRITARIDFHSEIT